VLRKSSCWKVAESQLPRVLEAVVA